MIRTRNQRGKTVKIAGVTALLSGTALALMSAMPAHAIGTLAGDLVSNTVTVNYKVNNVDQTAETATEEFVVDRMIDVLVESEGTLDTTPGTISTTTFKVTNDGNATQGYALDVSLAETYTPPGGTGTKALKLVSGAPANEGEYAIFYDFDGDGVFDAGDGDFYYDSTGNINAGDLDPDQSYFISVALYTPTDATTTDTFDFTLQATTLDAGTAVGAAGTVTAESAAGSLDATGPTAIDTVFVDAAGTFLDDVVEDGQHSATASSDVTDAVLNVTKEARVINLDGTDCGTVDVDPTALSQEERDNLYAIPGACIEYKITVTNTGDADATIISIADDLSAITAGVNFVGFITADTYFWKTSEDLANLLAAAEVGDVAPAYNGTTEVVSATEATLASSGGTIDLVFRVTLNTDPTP